MKAFREFLALPFILCSLVAIGVTLIFSFLATVIEGPQS